MRLLSIKYGYTMRRSSSERPHGDMVINFQRVLKFSTQHIHLLHQLLLLFIHFILFIYFYIKWVVSTNGLQSADGRIYVKIGDTSGMRRHNTHCPSPAYFSYYDSVKKICHPAHFRFPPPSDMHVSCSYVSMYQLQQICIYF